MAEGGGDLSIYRRRLSNLKQYHAEEMDRLRHENQGSRHRTQELERSTSKPQDRGGECDPACEETICELHVHAHSPAPIAAPLAEGFHEFGRPACCEAQIARRAGLVNRIYCVPSGAAQCRSGCGTHPQTRLHIGPMENSYLQYLQALSRVADAAKQANQSRGKISQG